MTRQKAQRSSTYTVYCVSILFFLLFSSNTVERMMNMLRRSGLCWTGVSLLWFLMLASNANGFSSLLINNRNKQRHVATGSVSASFADNCEERVPFVIDKLTTRTTLFTFQEISEMCIDVFFNDHGPNTTPWKQFQLSYQLPYLRNIQRTDLYMRKSDRKLVNDMFVARRVLPATKDVDGKTPLILDTSTICNVVDESVQDYVRGPVIGFVEVTERNFGLGPPYDNHNQDETKNGRSSSNKKKNASLTMRPILTNLSVHPSFRTSGVGSQLLQTCEQTVANEWRKSEIVLEVEHDNPGALGFYLKRGYSVVFEDPTSRRFSTNGLFVNKETCTKICMRKELAIEGRRSSSFMGSTTTLLQTLRDTVFSR